MRKYKVHLLVLIAAIAVAAVAWGAFRKHEGPRIVVHHPVRAPLTETIVASGRIVQERESKLGPMMQGTVAQVLVAQGDEVEDNQLLIKLANEEAAARVEEAEAAVRQATVRLETVQGLGRKLAARSLQQARTDEQSARKEFERQQKLYAADAITEVEIDRARSSLSTAQTRRVQAALELAASAPKGSHAAEAAAGLARAQAALRSVQVGLERTEIRAPSQGVVLRRDVERGEVVKPGQELLTFAAQGALSVSIHPDETALGKLAIGQEALVSPEAFPERKINAVVRHIAPSVDADQGTIEVDLSLENGTGLRPEMTVSVEVIVANKDGALVLPSSLIRDQAGANPWVLEVQDGRAVRTTIQIGLRGDRLCEVTTGIGESSQIVPPGASTKEGDPVRVKKVVPAVEQ